MVPITIITTYYNERRLLKTFIDNYLMFKKVYDDLSIIVVDDGSSLFPADQEQYLYTVPGLSLYKVTKDLGFNSHGARNLAMSKSNTYWNLMIDVDQRLDKNTFDVIFSQQLNNNDVYQLTVNTLLINKDCFFSCNGYDEEFVNTHLGDRHFHNYLKNNFNFVYLKTIKPKFLRLSRKVEYMDIPITIYEHNKLYHPISSIEKIKYIIPNILNRYQTGDFSTKKIINFDWVKVI